MTSATGIKINQAGVVAAILILAIIMAILLFVYQPVAQKQPAPYEPPRVNTIAVNRTGVRIPVISQGTIEAKSEIELSVEVPGRISEISSKLNDGEYFDQGHVLARLDNRDYQLAITKAEAQVAAAKQALARVQAEAEQARFDIQRMGKDPSHTSSYALREPHLMEAQANLKAAKADLAIARLQLQRTQVRAPFDGRVVEKLIDVGEYVTPGTPVARIYSTAVMQIKLPLTQSQLRLISLPTKQGDDADLASKVLVETDYAGKKLQWQARLTGVESMVDARNRLLNAIAEIGNGALVKNNGEVASTAGLFVRATIEGRLINDVFVVPRQALHNGGEVWILLDDNRLDIRKVTVLHKDDESAYIKQGLSDGERVITSALDYAISGMLLSPVE